MGNFAIGTKCQISGWEITDSSSDGLLHFLTIKNFNITRKIWISEECLEYARSKREIIRWLLFKNKIPTVENDLDFTKPSQKLLNSQILERIISENFIPETPEERFDQFLIDISILFPQYEGFILEEELLNFSFFKTTYGLTLFLDAFQEKGYLEVLNGPYTEKRNGMGSSSHSKGKYSVQVKFEGLKYLAELGRVNRFSNRCFIAMSFSDSETINRIKQTIKEAVSLTKHQPILINEVNFESHITINDAIIAEIKKAKFIIADFTEQKSGVYFEAGYALGLGIPVIYCCHFDDFEKSHFDLNHYPHIIYKDMEELREALKYKIEAWID